MFLVTIGLACRMCFVKERISLISMIVCPVMSAVRSRSKQQPSCTVKHPGLPSELSVFNNRKIGTHVGLFAIAMAYDLCNRQDPFVSTYNESRLRSHLQRCCQQERISQFPGGNPSRRRRKRILNEISVDVFCTCQYPDIDITTHLGNMVCCSVCEEWFHEEGEEIPDNVFTEAVDWACLSCNKWLCICGCFHHCFIVNSFVFCYLNF